MLLEVENSWVHKVVTETLKRTLHEVVWQRRKGVRIELSLGVAAAFDEKKWEGAA